MTLSPPLRWAGGKSWLVDQLVPEIVAKKPTLYVEPFVGAGAIALAMPGGTPMILSDGNASLMNLWEQIKIDPKSLHDRVTQAIFTYGHNKDGYLLARLAFNTSTNAMERAGLMLYLNALCFNGLWRENAKGEFNVPFGDVKRIAVATLDELCAISNHLGSADLYCSDFQTVIDACQRGAVIYADPPYASGFVDYTSDGFDESDQRRLASALQRAAERGVKIWTTNADVSLIHEIYSWAIVAPVEESRNIGSRVERRKPAGCLVIRSG